MFSNRADSNSAILQYYLGTQGLALAFLSLAPWLDLTQLNHGLARLSSKHFLPMFGSTQLSSMKLWLDSTHLEKMMAQTIPTSENWLINFLWSVVKSKYDHARALYMHCHSSKHDIRELTDHFFVISSKIKVWSCQGTKIQTKPRYSGSWCPGMIIAEIIQWSCQGTKIQITQASVDLGALAWSLFMKDKSRNSKDLIMPGHQDPD